MSQVFCGHDIKYPASGVCYTSTIGQNIDPARPDYHKLLCPPGRFINNLWGAEDRHALRSVHFTCDDGEKEYRAGDIYNKHDWVTTSKSHTLKSSETPHWKSDKRYNSLRARRKDQNTIYSINGNDYSFECPADSYLTGIEVQAGDWTSSLRGICAPDPVKYCEDPSNSVTAYCRQWFANNREVDPLQTANVLLNSCKKDFNSYCRLNDEFIASTSTQNMQDLNQLYANFCRANPLHPKCSCINAVQQFTMDFKDDDEKTLSERIVQGINKQYPPHCWFSTCRNEGWKPPALRVLTTCPNIKVCAQDLQMIGQSQKLSSDNVQSQSCDDEYTYTHNTVGNSPGAPVGVVNNEPSRPPPTTSSPAPPTSSPAPPTSSPAPPTPNPASPQASSQSLSITWIIIIVIASFVILIIVALVVASVIKKKRQMIRQ
jgi:hypothetical protein